MGLVASLAPHARESAPTFAARLEAHARRIRAARPGRDIYLVALTGYGQADDRLRALQAGFDLHLTKPVDPQQINDLTG
jgi:CheY-like chemotaxis protein